MGPNCACQWGQDCHVRIRKIDGMWNVVVRHIAEEICHDKSRPFSVYGRRQQILLARQPSWAKAMTYVARTLADEQRARLWHFDLGLPWMLHG